MQLKDCFARLEKLGYSVFHGEEPNRTVEDCLAEFPEGIEGCHIIDEGTFGAVLFGQDVLFTATALPVKVGEDGCWLIQEQADA